VDNLDVRRRFSNRLFGHGVEIGPGHVPFPVPPGVAVRYVDRWEPSENGALFPELGESPGFPEPDIVSNLDEDRLGGLADESQDFVIASHVIEHLANPLAMLVDIYRVLRPDGLLILLVPDRHVTFDRDRSPTSLAHLVDEYERDVRAVDDAHITEFVLAIRTVGEGEPENREVTAEEIDAHRRRSVHVHVWNVFEFTALLDHAATKLGVHWEVLDTMKPGEEGTHGNEFGWLLARRPPPIPPASERKRHRWAWSRSRSR